MKGRTMGLLSSTVGHGLPWGLGGARRLCALWISPAGGTPFRGDRDSPDPRVAALGEDPSGEVSPLLGATQVGQCTMGSSH